MSDINKCHQSINEFIKVQKEKESGLVNQITNSDSDSGSDKSIYNQVKDILGLKIKSKSTSALNTRNKLSKSVSIKSDLSKPVLYVRPTPVVISRPNTSTNMQHVQREPSIPVVQSMVTPSVIVPSIRTQPVTVSSIKTQPVTVSSIKTQPVTVPVPSIRTQEAEPVLRVKSMVRRIEKRTDRTGGNNDEFLSSTSVNSTYNAHGGEQSNFKEIKHKAHIDITNNIDKDFSKYENTNSSDTETFLKRLDNKIIEFNGGNNEINSDISTEHFLNYLEEKLQKSKNTQSGGAVNKILKDSFIEGINKGNYIDNDTITQQDIINRIRMSGGEKNIRRQKSDEKENPSPESDEEDDSDEEHVLSDSSSDSDEKENPSPESDEEDEEDDDKNIRRQKSNEKENPSSESESESDSDDDLKNKPSSDDDLENKPSSDDDSSSDSDDKEGQSDLGGGSEVNENDEDEDDKSSDDSSSSSSESSESSDDSNESKKDKKIKKKSKEVNRLKINKINKNDDSSSSLTETESSDTDSSDNDSESSNSSDELKNNKKTNVKRTTKKEDVDSDDSMSSIIISSENKSVTPYMLSTSSLNTNDVNLISFSPKYNKKKSKRSK
jgi:hypothetical protein